MLPWDPSGKIGPKKPLPDHVSIVEPKEEILPTTPISEQKGGKPEQPAMPQPVPTAWGVVSAWEQWEGGVLSIHAEKASGHQKHKAGILGRQAAVLWTRVGLEHCTEWRVQGMGQSSSEHSSGDDDGSVHMPCSMLCYTAWIWRLWVITVGETWVGCLGCVGVVSVCSWQHKGYIPHISIEFIPHISIEYILHISIEYIPYISILSCPRIQSGIVLEARWEQFVGCFCKEVIPVWNLTKVSGKTSLSGKNGDHLPKCRKWGMQFNWTAWFVLCLG